MVWITAKANQVKHRNRFPPDDAGHSEQGYSFYGAHQAGITTPHQQFGIVAVFGVLSKTPKELELLFRAITTRADFLTKGGELQDGDPKLPPQGRAFWQGG